MQFKTMRIDERDYFLWPGCIVMCAQMYYAKNTTEIDELTIINVDNNVKINAHTLYTAVR